MPSSPFIILFKYCVCVCVCLCVYVYVYVYVYGCVITYFHTHMHTLIRNMDYDDIYYGEGYSVRDVRISALKSYCMMLCMALCMT